MLWMFLRELSVELVICIATSTELYTRSLCRPRGSESGLVADIVMKLLL